MVRLPKSLEKEPLVEAVFEVRFGGKPQLSEILPGALFSQFPTKPKIQRLPANEIPQPIRASDPKLVFVPVLRLELENITLAIGDRNIVIGCKLPYPKWPAFKAAILDTTERVASIGVEGPVERYSIKYVNLIQAPSIPEQLSKIELKLKLGDIDVKEEHVSIHVHRQEDEILHLMSVVTGAQTQKPEGKRLDGVIVDIDSILICEYPDFVTFAAELEPAVERLRQANKVKFFSCITEPAVEEMGPQYD